MEKEHDILIHLNTVNIKAKTMLLLKIHRYLL
jgi:hypothetical protein